MKYQIVKDYGKTYIVNKKCIGDIPTILKTNAIIIPIIRKGSVFDKGGKKQLYRKREQICIVDSRPNVMMEKLNH